MNSTVLAPGDDQPEAALQCGPYQVPLTFRRHPRARRYILRLRPDGVAQITVPRRGTLRGAREFVDGQTAWLERQLETLAHRPARRLDWRAGDTVFFRGEPAVLVLEPDASGLGWVARLGSETVPTPQPSADLRPVVERHLWRLAREELPARTLALAANHGLAVRRVTVRNQRSRWGSCSSRGGISLNWRLVQMPDSARDYIILHELAHLRHPNHSPRFWREVGRLCPGYREAEAWIRRHQAQLR